MIEQLKTIREALLLRDMESCEEALAALTQLEAMVGSQEPVAWCPALTYPGHEKDRAWANGKPRKEDIECWTLNGRGITYAYAAPVAQQQSTEWLRQMLDEINETDSARWEVGFRNIVAILYGPKHTFEIKDVVERVREIAQQPQAEAVPSSDLNPDEGDPVTLWAEIWRLREAVKGPDGYATWQDAATAERIRRVRAESKQAEEAKAVPTHDDTDLIKQMLEALRSCSGVSHWPALVPTINAARKRLEAPQQAEAVPPDVVRDAERYRWLRQEHERHDPLCHLSWKQNSNRNGSEWVNTANLDAAIDAAIAQQKGASHE